MKLEVSERAASGVVTVTPHLRGLWLGAEYEWKIRPWFWFGAL